jgi:hypothetical protein
VGSPLIAGATGKFGGMDATAPTLQGHQCSPRPGRSQCGHATHPDEKAAHLNPRLYCG